MARLRNTNFDVFIPCQYTRAILRKKNLGQSLFKKHSKYQNFDEIFCCGITRLRNKNLNVFIQRQYTRTILRNKNMGQNQFKKHLLWYDQAQEHEFGYFFYTRIILRNENLGQSLFKKY